MIMPGPNTTEEGRGHERMTHLPVQFVPKSFWEQNCRVVYVARNAKDNLVSYFHFDKMNLVEPEPGDWNHFLQRFMDGKMVFGPWYDHVTNWWEKKQTNSKIHYMFYEDMIEERLVTGRTISLWPRVNSLIKIIRQR
ncbi:hypothetical protein DPEC_G00374650 [Dallia pectoralis]|nr:hypothetical protein DPEC_G00374650 [Dallia pectoralis]